MAVIIRPDDANLSLFANQIGALGAGRARPALARAVNRVTTMVRTRVIREVTRQSSLPRSMVANAIKKRLVKPGGSDPIEGIVWAKGRPVSLKFFNPRQLSYGVRAKVQGRFRKYEGTFMGPRPGVVAQRLGGHVWQRTSSARLPIEMIFGPSVPEELVRDASERVFREVVASHLPQRIRHELARLLE